MLFHLLIITNSHRPHEPTVLIATSMSLLAEKFQDYADEFRDSEYWVDEDQFDKEIEDIKAGILEEQIEPYPELTIAHALKYLKIRI